MKIVTDIARRNDREQVDGQFNRGSSRARGSEILSHLVLLFLIGCLHAGAQSTAGLSLSGTMPAIQRLEISPAQPPATANNPFTIKLNTRSNVAGSYTVTIQSQTLSAHPNAGWIAYELTCNGIPITLAAGAATALPESAGDRSAPKVLRISRPSVPSGDTLALTIISQ